MSPPTSGIGTQKKARLSRLKEEITRFVFANPGCSAQSIVSHLSNEMKFKIFYPNIKFCGDNAAMIAWAGIKRFKKNLFDDINVTAKSRWPLDETAPYMKGPGLKI